MRLDVLSDTFSESLSYELNKRPNAEPQVRRWRVCEARRATAQNAQEKRARFGAAPAASPAGHVGRRVDRDTPINKLILF